MGLSVAAASKPNILLIHADQLRFDALAVNGHPLIRTPNLDRLAAEGVNYSHAFCPAPVCTPARASLLSGLWPTQHGCIANTGTEAGRPMIEPTVTWRRLLAAAGYRLGYVGKWSVDEAGPTAHGFHDYVPDSAYGAWRQARGIPPRPRCGWFGGTDPHAGADQSRLAWGADETIRLLREYAAGPAPFLLRWDPPEPHLPNIVPEPFASMYRPQSIAPWPSFPDPLEAKPYIQRQQRRTWEVEGWTWPQWQPLVARYLGEVSLMDQQIGRVLEELERLGAADDTLVVFSTDHGDLCGAHGMIDKHHVMYDDVVRVPLIARWPGRLARGITCDAFVCNALDLAVTLLSVAGLTSPPSFMGQVLSGFPGDDLRRRNDIFAMYQGSQFGLYSQRMVRDRRWKYVWNATAEDELYDLSADPGEIVNRARDGSCASELARLRRRLIEWMQSIGDPLLNGWTRRQLEGGLKA